MPHKCSKNLCIITSNDKGRLELQENNKFGCHCTEHNVERIHSRTKIQPATHFLVSYWVSVTVVQQRTLARPPPYNYIPTNLLLSVTYIHDISVTPPLSFEIPLILNSTRFTKRGCSQH